MPEPAVAIRASRAAEEAAGRHVCALGLGAELSAKGKQRSAHNVSSRAGASPRPRAATRVAGGPEPQSQRGALTKAHPSREDAAPGEPCRPGLLPHGPAGARSRGQRGASGSPDSADTGAGQDWPGSPAPPAPGRSRHCPAGARGAPPAGPHPKAAARGAGTTRSPRHPAGHGPAQRGRTAPDRTGPQFPPDGTAATPPQPSGARRHSRCRRIPAARGGSRHAAAPTTPAGPRGPAAVNPLRSRGASAGPSDCPSPLPGGSCPGPPARRLRGPRGRASPPRLAGGARSERPGPAWPGPAAGPGPLTL